MQDTEELKIEEPEGTPRSIAERIGTAAPWWLISILAHGILAIIGIFIVAVSHRGAVEEIVLVAAPREVPEEIKPKRTDLQTKELELEKKVDDPVIYKAPDADHTETPNDEDFQKAKGEAMDALSDKPFQGKSVYDTIGSGGGGGGKYGGRFGGKLLSVAKGGGGKDTEEAVLNALRWLARHQSSDGSWKTSSHVETCGRVAGFKGGCRPNPGQDGYSVGVTGLSLLAFLGAGYTHASRDTYDGICFGTVVKKGLKYLVDSQQPSGRITPENRHYMYNHLIAAFALSEAFGITASTMLKDPAQKAVDYTMQAQNPGRGWRYTFRSGDNDSSVSGWGAQVLKSAEVAELSVTKESMQGVLAWFDQVTEKSYSRVSYTEKTAHVTDRPSMTAIGVMTRIFLSKNKSDPRIRGGAQVVLADLPEWSTAKKTIDLYYWYYASFMMFQFDGPSGPFWRKWNEKLKAAVMDHQNKTAGQCRHGSWEPVDPWSGQGGRVYATATGALILEVYYRYPNVFIEK